MKWIRRVLYLIAFGLILAIIGSFVSYRLARGTPSWYQPEKLTDAERAEADNQAIQRSLSLSSWAAEVTNLQRRRLHGRAKPGEQINPITLTLTEHQLNTLWTTWSATPSAARLVDKTSRYLTGGRVILLDDKLVVAGQLKDAGFASDTIVSVHFRPSIDDKGQLRADLDSVYGGMLPLPRSAFSGSEQKLRAVLDDGLPNLQSQAEMGSDGIVNGKAVSAAMAKLALHALDGTPADSLIFLQADPSDPHHAVPAKLTAVKIENKAMTFTLAALTAEELTTVMDKVQTPLAKP